MSEPKEIIGIRIVQGEVCKVERPAQEPSKIRPREEPPVTLPPWLTFESPSVLNERLRQSAIDARKALAQEIAAAMREQEPQAEPALAESQDKRTRTDCLKEAMLTAVDTLRSELGRNPNVSNGFEKFPGESAQKFPVDG